MPFSTIRIPYVTSCVVGALFLTGCAATENQTPGASPSLLEKLLGGPTFGSKPENCGTALQCKSVLKTMIDDPKRSWVGQPQAADAFADGTRLFAYRGLRAKLSCRELNLAIDEIKSMAKLFAEPVSGVAPDRVSKTLTLSRQVEGELLRERVGRCKP